MANLPIILGSTSMGRLKMLNSIGINPDIILDPNIDETPLKKELPQMLAKRLSINKSISLENKIENGILITADTICAAGRMLIPKAKNNDDIRYYLEKMSGRRINIYTGLTVTKICNYSTQTKHTKLVSSIVKLKRLSKAEIESYILTKEGIGKSGGCSILGKAQLFFSFISGSHSNIVGLPLFQLNNILVSLGIKLL